MLPHYLGIYLSELCEIRELWRGDTQLLELLLQSLGEGLSLSLILSGCEGFPDGLLPTDDSFFHH